MTKKLSIEEKEKRKLERKEKLEKEKLEKEISSYKNQPEIEQITMIIEWKKSKTWGHIPHLTAKVIFKDKNLNSEEKTFSTSGCGYDKESTVIAKCFNHFLRYKLYQIENKKNKPYGINIREENSSHYYGSGIGTSCYYQIAEFIGGKLENIASSTTVDVYAYTDNN